ncbi:PilN domain-containing protein [Oculatella sp. LEGE 06141]|uniref:PilN domain-containing protein n=1 Tax=Oculatella sp. LEGE 06141 TaxID=1828648 RepID=UPI0018810079|nr:PilN domain-containing protein [Oculatella sp. LEGE 06141]MBE9179911.1 PilN domain-containing protein [Oculatella sp. LEGE 06141]
MYSLDINFLSDRTERPSERFGPPSNVVQESPRPLYLGVAVGVFLLGASVGLWLLLQNRNAELVRQQAALDSQLAEANAQLSQIDAINTEIAQIDQQNQALATVFDRIKPWSAILQDLRDRVPPGVQVNQIAQEEPPPAAAPVAPEDPSQPAPAAPEPPPSTIQITGNARSFNDVNDFLLVLQRSPFLDAQETRLVTAELVDNPADVEFSGETSGNIEVDLPQVVAYTISSQLTPIPASQLLQDLERTLSVGLATRIQALRDRGVLQQ